LDGALGKNSLAGDGTVLDFLVHTFVGNVVGNVVVGLSHRVGDLLDLGHGVMFNYGSVGDVGLVLGLVLDLFVVGVRHVDWVVVRVLDGLIVGNGLGDVDGVSNRGNVLVHVLAVVWYLFVSDHWLVIGVGLLDGNVLDPGLGLGSSVSLLDLLLLD